MSRSMKELHLSRLKEMERFIKQAEATIDNVSGRAQVDNRGLGAVQFLLGRSLRSLEAMRLDIEGIEENFPKVCSCGASYTEATWKSLEIVGEMHDGEGEAIELRNCPCGSTISIVIPEETTDDRTDLGDECAREARAERERDWQEAG